MIDCYVVVSKGVLDPHKRVADVPSANIGPLTAKRLGSPTIFMSTIDKSLAVKLAKEIGGRVCRLVEEQLV